jgi:hypothetical protein
VYSLFSAINPLLHGIIENTFKCISQRKGDKMEIHGAEER